MEDKMYDNLYTNMIDYINSNLLLFDVEAAEIYVSNGKASLNGFSIHHRITNEEFEIHSVDNEKGLILTFMDGPVRVRIHQDITADRSVEAELFTKLTNKLNSRGGKLAKKLQKYL